MNISAAAVKALRDRTNQPMMDCKAALIEAKGDNDKAVEILRKKSKDVQDKKVSREMAEGRIAAYVDAAQKVGALLEMRCESAPVAKSDQFAQLGLFAFLQIGGPRDVLEWKILLAVLCAKLERRFALIFQAQVAVGAKTVTPVEFL